MNSQGRLVWRAVSRRRLRVINMNHTYNKPLEHEPHNNASFFMCGGIVADSLVVPIISDLDILISRLDARKYLVIIQEVLIEMPNDVLHIFEAVCGFNMMWRHLITQGV